MLSLIHAIKNFGFKEVTRQFIYHKGEFMGGILVGTDKLKNRYYEVTDPIFQKSGRLRYVEYSSNNYDSSQIQPEW